MLQALTRKFHVSADVDMPTVAQHVPLQCTGADMYGMCADAWMHALRRTIAACVASGRASSSTDVDDDLEDVDIEVTMADFMSSASNLVPSLTLKDLDKYDALQQEYAPSGGAKKAAGLEPNGAAPAPSPSGGLPGRPAVKGLKLRPSTSVH